MYVRWRCKYSTMTSPSSCRSLIVQYCPVQYSSCAAATYATTVVSYRVLRTDYDIYSSLLYVYYA